MHTVAISKAMSKAHMTCHLSICEQDQVSVRRSKPQQFDESEAGIATYYIRTRLVDRLRRS